MELRITINLQGRGFGGLMGRKMEAGRLLQELGMLIWKIDGFGHNPTSDDIKDKFGNIVGQYEVGE